MGDNAFCLNWNLFYVLLTPLTFIGIWILVLIFFGDFRNWHIGSNPFLWKNYRNNRLKHILPRPLAELAEAPPPAAAPPLPSAPPVPAPTIYVTAAPGPALCPLQYGIPPGSALAKIDMRSGSIERRKRKSVH